MHIVYVSDGKAGHRSQALGLYRAIQRQYQYDVSFQELPLAELSWVSLAVAMFRSKLNVLNHSPSFIIGVGSHTQSRVLALGKIYPQAKTIILMKSNYPFAWFDYVVVPEHDGITAQDHVVVTQGALNPIVNEARHQSNRILIALGGSSKRHQWNGEKVLQRIEQIVVQNAASEIILTTSRRTPKEFLMQLKAQSYSHNLKIFPVEETPQGWIFEQMQLAEAVWVTEDSVSMIYEALTAGCKVGVIQIDRLKEDRITHSIDLIVDQQLVAYTAQLDQLPKPTAFKEAERVATYLLAP
jgi:uncharacterized protein